MYNRINFMHSKFSKTISTHRNIYFQTTYSNTKTFERAKKRHQTKTHPINPKFARPMTKTKHKRPIHSPHIFSHNTSYFSHCPVI